MGRGLEPRPEFNPLDHGLPGIEPYIFVPRGLARQ